MSLITDEKGQMQIVNVGIGAVIGVLMIIIFATFYASAPKDNLSGAAVSFLDMGDFILAAMLIVSIVLGFLAVSSVVRR